ncbi:MAG: hypothetical protein AAFZ63_10540 [Bacteroidota bacterium]
MADENPTTPEQDVPDNGTPAPEFSADQTNDKLVDYSKSLADYVKSASSLATVKCTEYDSKKVISGYKHCAYQEASNAYNEYTNISLCISTQLTQDIAQIKANLTVYNDQSTLVGEKIVAGQDQVRAMKKLVTEVNELAGKLNEALKDSCNSQQKRSLVNGITAVNDDLAFMDAITEIIECAESACEKADTAFETGVKVAGINAFKNVESLVEPGTNLETNTNLFNTDVTGNITFATEQMATSMAELTTAQQEETMTEAEKYKALLLKAAIVETEAYAKNVEAIDVSGLTSIEDICEKVKKTFVGETC